MEIRIDREHLAKVAVAHLRRGHTVEIVSAVPFEIALISAEEEQLSFRIGPPTVPPPMLMLEFSFPQLGGGVTSQDGVKKLVALSSS
jgi:hypothetical protein